jgi:hypothetical protein
MPLISFIQRRVKKIILFYSSSVPLQPTSNWNIDETDVYLDSQITDDLSCFFGAFQTNETDVIQRIYFYTKNQIFDIKDYSKVVKGLQNKQESGHGIIETFNLTTIENKWWGIPQGLEFEITFVYSGRLSAWEKKLSPEMYELVVPKTNSEDLSVTVDEGPFQDFPHYNTTGGSINSERANLLANLNGWSVMENKELFQNILS